jgi:glc operon protein GlcG
LESRPDPPRRGRRLCRIDGLVTQRYPSLEHALALLAAIRTQADAQSLALAAYVVDAAGHVIASQRMDGAALGAMRLALGKAYTAALWGMRTGDFTESTAPGGADWGFNTTDDRIVVYAGGLPLYADGELVGAAGASGGTPEQDEACVKAAALGSGFTVG